jgi:hypothetical protein
MLLMRELLSVKSLAPSKIDIVTAGGPGREFTSGTVCLSIVVNAVSGGKLDNGGWTSTVGIEG